MPHVCFGKEASARYCEKVVFYFTIDLSSSKRVKDTPQITIGE